MKANAVEEVHNLFALTKVSNLLKMSCTLKVRACTKKSSLFFKPVKCSALRLFIWKATDTRNGPYLSIANEKNPVKHVKDLT